MGIGVIELLIILGIIVSGLVGLAVLFFVVQMAVRSADRKPPNLK